MTKKNIILIILAIFITIASAIIYKDKKANFDRTTNAPLADTLTEASADLEQNINTGLDNASNAIDKASTKVKEQIEKTKQAVKKTTKQTATTVKRNTTNTQATVKKAAEKTNASVKTTQTPEINTETTQPYTTGVRNGNSFKNLSETSEKANYDYNN